MEETNIENMEINPNMPGQGNIKISEIIEHEKEQYYIQPNPKGPWLDHIRMGGYRCLKCDWITHGHQTEKGWMEPFECGNKECGRKGSFTKTFPPDLTKPIWPLAGIPKDHVAEDIYVEIYNYCKKHLVLMEDEYHIMTLWILASWLPEEFDSIPYLAFIAPKSSGKTQAINVLHELAYRAYATISTTPAALFRAIEKWHITLLVDEAETQVRKDTETGQALYGCLNGGYKRGSGALRTELIDKNYEPKNYDVFGFKALSATKLFLPTLESRCITIYMRQGKPEHLFLDKDKAKTIRSMLLYWRHRALGHLAKKTPPTNNGRLAELFTPLYSTAIIINISDYDTTPNQERDEQSTAARHNAYHKARMPIQYPDLITLLDRNVQQMETQREEDEESSPEAEMINAITDLANEQQEDEQTIPLRDIAQKLDWMTSKDKPNSWRVGNLLKTLGLRAKHLKTGNVFCISDNMERWGEVVKRYLHQTSPSADSEKTALVKR